MLRRLKEQSLAITIACLALFIALGGPAAAGHLINGKNIKNKSIAGAKLKNNTITANKVKAGTLTATQVKRGQFARSIPMVRVPAAAGADENAGRLNAKPVVLHRAGALTLYAKCFNDDASDRTHYEIYVKTSRNGSLLNSRNDELNGGNASTDFLNTNSPETDTQVEYDSVGPNSADGDAQDSSDFAAVAPDGSWMRGWSGGFVKRGNLTGGNGVYGSGNVCIFVGSVSSS